MYLSHSAPLGISLGSCIAECWRSICRIHMFLHSDSHSSMHRIFDEGHGCPRSCSRPVHKGTGTPAGFSWWRGWGSRQRPCKGNRSQGKRRRSKKAGRVGYCSSGQELPGHLKGEPAVVSPFWGFRGPGTAWTSLRTGTHGHGEVTRCAAAARPGQPGQPG